MKKKYSICVFLKNTLQCLSLYNAFASPFVRAERERAERAEKQAESYAAILKSLGVDVNDLPDMG